jgi:hypothetical protein
MENDFPGDDNSSFVARVFNNEAVKKGLAGAAAGLLVAVVSEALWPSK